jgi:hypothetical protein
MKRKTLKKISFFISSFFIFLIHLPFVFAKNKPRNLSNKLSGAIREIKMTADTVLKPVQQLVTDPVADLYESLKLKTMGMARQAFETALKGFNRLKASGKLRDTTVVTIADFSQPSANKRLYVIDIKTKEVLFNTWVAHGKNSGQETATSFSDAPQSNKSSLGFYVTLNPYQGRNGFSLQLNGVEKGFNTNALDRGIVMHAAEYVNESYIQSQGWIGRSQGCPAVAPELNVPIINTIKDGSCFFIYSPDENYLHRSSLLN